MGEKSFLKGYCPRQNRYWGMTLEKFGGRWEIVDVIPLTPEQARVTASQVEQPSFSVHNNLQACRYDQRAGRIIQSSDRVPCPRDPKAYSFHCIYCKHMELSYDADTSGYREGETIKLSQGQEIRIASGGRSLEEIELNVGWDPDEDYGAIDIDSSVLLYKNRHQSSELVCYYNLNDRSRSVIHHGDNVTGEPVNGQSDVDEVIDINLKKVPGSYDKLAILINVFSGETFGVINNVFIRLYDKRTHKKICDYQISKNIDDDRGLVIGLVQRKADGWTFKATADAIESDDLDDLVDYVIDRY